MARAFIIRPFGTKGGINFDDVQKLRTYASFVRFSHSVFALPFALTGALLALNATQNWTRESLVWRTLWIVVAMVAARSAAMGFNRLADARYDALNPRTASRELPRGAMTIREAAAFVAVASVAFVFAAWRPLRASAGRLRSYQRLRPARSGWARSRSR